MIGREGKMRRWVPSVRALLLAGAALVTLTLAAAASIVSIGPGLHVSVEREPVVAWIALTVVLATFAMILLAVWRHSKR